MLVDTGSPVSFGDINKIIIEGREFTLSPFISNVKKFMPENVVALIGMDIINNYDVKIEKGTTLVEFSNEFYEDSKNELQLKTAGGLPVFEADLLNRRVNCIFDLGAHIPYIESSFTRNLSSVGKANDFNPIIGDINTDLYRIAIYTQTIQKELMFGTSSDLDTIFRLYRVQGVVGLEFFSDYTLVLSMRRNRIFLR